MLCPNCGYNNQPNNRFCVRCGIDVSVPAPAETSSFETGQPTAPAPPPASAPSVGLPPTGPHAPPNPWGAPHPPGPYAAAGAPPPPPYPGPATGDPTNPFAPPAAYQPPAGPPGQPPGRPPSGYPPPGVGPYAPYPQPYAPSGYQAQPTNGLAIAALVLSLVGWIPCGIGSLAAVVLGFVARSQIRASQGRQGGDGLALAGIIIGFVAIAFWILVVVWGAATGSGNSS